MVAPLVLVSGIARCDELFVTGDEMTARLALVVGWSYRGVGEEGAAPLLPARR
jgi:hypothetical protein